MNRFKRSKSNKIFGGVCGGLANWTGINVWFWRILMLLITGSFWVYMLIWIFTDEDDDFEIFVK